jgi:pyruvate,water dikinase
MILLVVRMGYEFSRMSKRVRDFNAWFTNLLATVPHATMHEKSPYELLRMIREIQTKSLQKWAIPVLNDFRVMMLHGQVMRTLKSAHLESQMPGLLVGQDVISLEPARRIREIADEFRAQATALQLLRTLRGEALVTALRVRHRPLLEKCLLWIEEFGDRCAGELKLETVTPRQDPEKLFAEIRRASEIAPRDGAEFTGKRESSVYAVLQAHWALQTWWLTRWGSARLARVRVGLFRKRVGRLKQSLADREELRLQRTRMFGAMRDLYSHMGDRFFRQGFLNQTRDIFFLTENEIDEYVMGRSYLQDIRGLVKLRREAHDEYLLMNARSQMEIYTPLAAGITRREVTVPEGPRENHLSDGSSSISALQGLGCSPGVCEGEVVVVHSPDEVSDVHDRILVATRTDPGWAPLMATARGLIIEKGSMLSHSAVLAREMGITAVVNVPRVMTILKTGDRVRVYGETGKIELLGIGLPAEANGRSAPPDISLS